MSATDTMTTIATMATTSRGLQQAIDATTHRQDAHLIEPVCLGADAHRLDEVCLGAEQALRPRVMQRYLSPIYAVQTGGASANPACHILDAKYEPNGNCVVLYQLGERLVIGELCWQGTAQLQHQSQPIAVYAYEHDPALPGLTTVLDGQKMQGILSQTLPDCGAGRVRILRCRVTPVRYRLGKRCTLRFDLWLSERETGSLTMRTLYGKLYHSRQKAQAVYEEMDMLVNAPELQAGGVKVAQAVAFVPTLPLVLQAPVTGMPLDLFLSIPKGMTFTAHPHAAEGIRQAAAALATLHQSKQRTGRIRAITAEVERLQARSAHVMQVSPAVGADLHRLAGALSAGLQCLPAWGAESTLVHGDCKPSQFFIKPGAQPVSAMPVAILDFDHCGVADPAADVGYFLATLRQLGVKQRLKQRDAAMVAACQQWLATLEEEFLTTYLATRPCHPDFRRRATWYQAVALLRKALRSFSRSTRSPLPALLVQAAWRCLATLPD